MDSKQLEELLQRYWNCETSLEEEERLRDYFRTHDVPEHFKEATLLFSYFDRQRQQAVSTQFEETVVKKIKSPVGKSVTFALRQTGVWQTSLRIAAGVAVLVAAVYFVGYEIRNKDNEVAMEDTFDSPEQALEETKKALLMISKGFGKAEQQAKKINVLNEAKDKLKANETKEL
jgi:hypothetical protein